MASLEDKYAPTEQRPFPNHDDSSVESSDKDLAAAIVSDHAGEFDRFTEHRVLRKIDLYLIPWMWIGYGFVYYDKVREDDNIRNGERKLSDASIGYPRQRCPLRHDQRPLA